jgi:hypothetical protein
VVATMIELLAALGLIAFGIGLSLLMIRAMTQMWRYQGRSGTFSSGVAGAISELDRVVRPSVEHTLETKKSIEKNQDDDITRDWDNHTCPRVFEPTSWSRSTIDLCTFTCHNSSSRSTAPWQWRDW